MECKTIAQLITRASEIWEIPEELIISDNNIPNHKRRRSSQWVFCPRAAVSLAAYENLSYSYPKIGFYLNRHHTTVLHSVRRARALLAYDPAWTEKYSLLTA